jgi:hypothetical protein
MQVGPVKRRGNKLIGRIYIARLPYPKGRGATTTSVALQHMRGNSKMKARKFFGLSPKQKKRIALKVGRR